MAEVSESATVIFLNMKNVKRIRVNQCTDVQHAKSVWIGCTVVYMLNLTGQLTDFSFSYLKREKKTNKLTNNFSVQ